MSASDFLVVAGSNHRYIRYVSELLYIHTKLMIVDDRKVVVSADMILLRDPIIYCCIFTRWAQRTSTIAV